MRFLHILYKKDLHYTKEYCMHGNRGKSNNPGKLLDFKKRNVFFSFFSTKSFVCPCQRDCTEMIIGVVKLTNEGSKSLFPCFGL